MNCYNKHFFNAQVTNNVYNVIGSVTWESTVGAVALRIYDFYKIWINVHRKNPDGKFGTIFYYNFQNN